MYYKYMKETPLPISVLFNMLLDDDYILNNARLRIDQSRAAIRICSKKYGTMVAQIRSNGSDLQLWTTDTHSATVFDIVEHENVLRTIKMVLDRFDNSIPQPYKGHQN